MRVGDPAFFISLSPDSPLWLHSVYGIRSLTNSLKGKSWYWEGRDQLRHQDQVVRARQLLIQH